MADLPEDPSRVRRKMEPRRLSDNIPKGCRKIVYDWSEDAVYLSPDQKKEYYRQCRESLGFDIGKFPCIPVNGIMPHDVLGEPRIEVSLYARLGLHCFNIQKGTNLQFVCVRKSNYQMASFYMYYLTVEVKDLADGSPQTFQTTVTRGAPRSRENLRVYTDVCRLKPEIPGPGDAEFFWDNEAIDDFYKGPLPKWLSDDALAGADKMRFYEVQEADFVENDWLQLYTEFALFYQWRLNQNEWKTCLPVEIEKMVVETHDAIEPRMKLKSNNAYFYVSFRAKCGAYRAVIRKTMDGRPGHVSLQLVVERLNDKC